MVIFAGEEVVSVLFLFSHFLREPLVYTHFPRHSLVPYSIYCFPGHSLYPLKESLESPGVTWSLCLEVFSEPQSKPETNTDRKCVDKDHC